MAMNFRMIGYIKYVSIGRVIPDNERP